MTPSPDRIAGTNPEPWRNYVIPPSNVKWGRIGKMDFLPLTLPFISAQARATVKKTSILSIFLDHPA
jgi:hypothetical protein